MKKIPLLGSESKAEAVDNIVALRDFAIERQIHPQMLLVDAITLAAVHDDLTPQEILLNQADNCPPDLIWLFLSPTIRGILDFDQDDPAEGNGSG